MGLAAVVGFVLVSVFVVVYPMAAVDLSIWGWLQQETSPFLDVTARWISYLGSEALAALAVALAIWLGIRHHWRIAGLLVVTVGGSQLLNNVLKDFFQRARPLPVSGFIPAQQYSFPSGHAMVSMAFYLFVLWLCWEFLPGWTHSPLFLSLASICFMIGLSRMYVGAHYLTDVVAGGLAGFAWSDGVLLAAHAYWRRSSRHAIANGRRHSIFWTRDAP